MSKEAFKRDILPFIYHMIHPNIREINTQLFTKHEKYAFQSAIEIMVLFDITLKSESADNDSQVAQFEPDISSLLTFTYGRKEFMRNKT